MEGIRSISLKVVDGDLAVQIFASNI
jgi:hypothetical protein